MKRVFGIAGAAAVASGLALAAISPASAGTYTLRVGSGHPVGPAVYVTLLRDVFVAEVKKQAAKTKHKVTIIEGYGGTIAKVADTLEAVQS
ncbi:MAG: hypothetical protein KDJ29_18495, partial [Hyphomicrobiales bacterium]|nr:hypothetical protein [Hyphomicrobiales bacterium]